MNTSFLLMHMLTNELGEDHQVGKQTGTTLLSEFLQTKESEVLWSSLTNRSCCSGLQPRYCL